MLPAPLKNSPESAPAKFKGSMTIYLALVLIIILVLICTLIESARVSAISANLKSLTYMGADSVFSEFAEPIFSDYGIMVLWKSEADFTEEFNEYVEANLDDSDLAFSANANLYGMALTGSSLSSMTCITDENGLLFAEQVYDYMEYYLAQDAAEELLDSLDIFSQSDTVSDYMEKINSYTDVFTKVEEQVSEVKSSIDEVQSYTDTPQSLLEELYDSAESFSENGVSSSVFSETLTELKNLTSDLESSLEDVLEETDTYYEYVEDAQAAAEELQDTLLDEADDLDSDIYESLNELVEELSETTADSELDYYEVSANKNTTEEYIEKLESLENLFETLSGGLTEENAGEYMNAISAYEELFSDFDLDELGVNFDTSVTETEDSSILDFISGLLSEGVLAYVKDDISEKSVETEDFPSETVSYSASDSEESLSEATLNTVIFGEYVLTHFGNASEEKDDTALDYEAEYIIGGKDSDVENLKVVVNRITAIRSSLNFISILADSSKKSEAYTLATAMVGYTGMPVLIKVFQMLILSAWASAEAITDVKALLEGEKVPTIKDSDEWNLSIEGFKNFTAKDIEVISCDTGLDYEDYLRVLLAMENRQTQYYRTMDMIQADMVLNENEDFLMAECLCEAEICASYTASQLFTAIPLVKNNLNASEGNYTFTIDQAYSY